MSHLSTKRSLFCGYLWSESSASVLPRYLIVPNEQQAHWTISSAIERVVEQNHDQKFSYDRAALIKMLDAAIAKQAEVGQP